MVLLRPGSSVDAHFNHLNRKWSWPASSPQSRWLPSAVWLTPIIGRMVLGQGEIAFSFPFKLWEFLTWFSAKASRKKIKLNHCTVGLQPLFQRNNTRNFPLFSENVELGQFKTTSGNIQKSHLPKLCILTSMSRAF